MDLSLHPARFPTTLEKWYLDVLLDDGTVLLVYLGALSIAGMRLARVIADLYPPAGLPVHGSATARHVVGRDDTLRFGPATIAGDRLSFATAGISGELIYTPRHQPWTPREPFLASGDRMLHWVVEIPDANVTGTLRWLSGERAIAGRGYRDRVWFDLLPWRFPIHELVWGRAAAGDHAATWVRATTPQGIVAASWLDGCALAADAAGSPPSPVALGPTRVFLDTDVTALQGLQLGPLRGLPRRLSGDPHETKWQAPCTIAGAQGVAVQEVVRWHV